MKDKIYLIIIAVLLLIGTSYWIFTDTTIIKKNNEIKKLNYLKEELILRVFDKTQKVNVLMEESKEHLRRADSALNILNNKPELNEVKATRRINDIPLDSIGVESDRYYESHKND